MRTIDDVVKGTCSLDDYANDVIDNLNNKNKIKETLAYANKQTIVNELSSRIMSAVEQYSNELDKKGYKTNVSDECLYVRFSDGSQLELLISGSYHIRTKKMREYTLKTKQFYCKDKYQNVTLDSWDI